MRTRDFSRAFTLLILFCFCSCAKAQTSEADFTRQMAERFRAALPGRTVEITEPLQLRVGLSPDPATVNLGRVFNYCASATAEECTASIDRFVTASAEGLTHVDAPITREQLRLLVRNVEYCQDLREGGSADRPGPVIRPFVPGLCTILMADFPTNMRSVAENELGRLGLELEAAWTLAERQTLAELPSPNQLEGLQDSIVAVTDHDYLTSLMLNAEGWRAAATAQGELLVAVPASNAMIVARRANVTDLEGFRAEVRRHMESAERGVSPNIYRWTQAGWVLLE